MKRIILLLLLSAFALPLLAQTTPTVLLKTNQLAALWELNTEEVKTIAVQVGQDYFAQTGNLDRAKNVVESLMFAVEHSPQQGAAGYWYEWQLSTSWPIHYNLDFNPSLAEKDAIIGRMNTLMQARVLAIRDGWNALDN